MKVVCLLGSPKSKGNSAFLAKRFCADVEARGAVVETFSLNQLNYRGCQACMACKTKLDRCVLQDDLEPVLDAVRQTDVLVLASPVYYGEVTSQVKGFIDRTFSFLTPEFKTNPQNMSRLVPGKSLVFIQVQTAEDESNYNDIFPRYTPFFKWFGFDDHHLIRACGVPNPGDVKDKEEVLKQVEETVAAVFG
jgi:multimeric flavodoxin WrbA